MKVNKTVSVNIPCPPLWNRERLVAHKEKLWLVVWPYNDNDSLVKKIQFTVYCLGGLYSRLLMQTSLGVWSLFVGLVYIRALLFVPEN
ncbi:hypothetical protein SOVF_173900 [Spinacia oleracea]|nr:hypothetical protein SOVF_173900 [Spinacia oleracea]